MRYLSSRKVHLMVRFSIAGILAWAAVAKLSHTDGGQTLYDVWTASYPFLKIALPALELLFALLLVFKWRLRVTAYAIMAMLSMFTGFLIVEVGRPHPMSCGCIRAHSALYDRSTVQRDLSFGIGGNLVMMTGLAYLLLGAASDVGSQAANGETSSTQLMPGISTD